MFTFFFAFYFLPPPIHPNFLYVEKDMVKLNVCKCNQGVEKIAMEKWTHLRVLQRKFRGILCKYLGALLSFDLRVFFL